MLSDLPYIYLFWIVLFIIGLINLPITFLVFQKFIDRGYIFSKIIGLALISYSVWLLSLLKIMPFTTTTIAVVSLFWFFLNWFVFKKIKNNLFKQQVTPKILKLFLFEEVLFLGFFALWSFVRGFAPDIHGLEKFMDFGFINSILRTRFMPPLDMWLSFSPEYPNYTINYYYFGHFVTALLTRISTVRAEITYNLMLGVICGFTFTGVFSIACNLFAFFQKQKNLLGEFLYNRRTLVCGLLAGFLVTFGGNLHTIYAFTKGYSLDKPLPVWEVLGKPNPDLYWYPNATRFIPNTIHEFPIYSFIVSDLHGHVLDIPFVLLTIAFLFSFFVTIKQINNKRAGYFEIFRFKTLYWEFFYLPLLGLILAVMYMTNAWDGIIYLGLSGLVFLALHTKTGLKQTINFELDLTRFLPSIFLTVLFFMFFLLPFNRNFIPFAKGIGINCLTPNASNQVLCDHSPWWMLLILWGYFFYFALSFIFLVAIPAIKKNSTKNLNLTASEIFIILLIVISTFLLIAPEFIFARDIYPAHYRANTMFKLGYQAFMMLGIVVAFVVLRFKSISPFTKFKFVGSIWWKLAYLQLFLVAIYPLFGVNAYYNGLHQYQGLDGLTWMNQFYPTDKKAIDYFKKSLGTFEQPVILEAVGESYTDYARISAYTGLPTVVGWPVHEWLWRGSYDEAGKRQEEVRKIYEATDLREATDLLNKYKVKYVVISTLEQQKYPKLNEETFAKLGKIVFQSGPTKIYQLNI